MIQLHPVNARFVVPTNWLRLYREHVFNNLHLTQDQLKRIKETGESEWDADYARIVDAALPFEQCAVHAGGDGWGKDSRLYNDLQMRVYISSSSAVKLEETIKERALPIARLIAQHAHGKAAAAAEGGLPIELSKVAITQKRRGEWHSVTIAVPLWYNDYGGTGNVEFYIRALGGKSIAFVFMYASGSEQADTIRNIIASFDYGSARESN